MRRSPTSTNGPTACALTRSAKSGVTCGSTEAMISSMFGVLNYRDEVVIFEPYYENYGPDTVLCGAVPRYVKLHPPD